MFKNRLRWKQSNRPVAAMPLNQCKECLLIDDCICTLSPAVKEFRKSYTDRLFGLCGCKDYSTTTISGYIWRDLYNTKQARQDELIRLSNIELKHDAEIDKLYKGKAQLIAKLTTKHISEIAALTKEDKYKDDLIRKLQGMVIRLENKPVVKHEAVSRGCSGCGAINGCYC